MLQIFESLRLFMIKGKAKVTRRGIVWQMKRNFVGDILARVISQVLKFHFSQEGKLLIAPLLDLSRY